MKLGLIGHPLGHSWSAQIHHFLIQEEYQKWDLSENEFDDFMQKRDFDGINVTIPYKQKVMSYLDVLDPAAEAIGAVNCIVNREGKLTGYNTDYLGFMQMLEANHVDVQGKHTALLGTGGASKAAAYALKKLGAEVQKVSRSEKPGCITYAQLYEDASSYACIVNVTPVGMYPNTNESAVDPAKFPQADTVIDIVANPLRTKLLFDAKVLGMKTVGGFEMLVRQAFAADELFTGRQLDPILNEACMDALYHQKRNIVLIGMPTSGKTTLAKMVAKNTRRPYLDMDDEIEKKLGTTIKACFAEHGEAYFRQIEQKTAEECRDKTGCVISCGGGVVTNEDTMRALSENGIIIWIQRDLQHLFSTSSRPLTGDEEYMQQLYAKRKELYQKYSDCIIENNGSLAEAAAKIQKAAGENYDHNA